MSNTAIKHHKTKTKYEGLQYISTFRIPANSMVYK